MLELNKVYCGNCLKVMEAIPNNSIDMVLTSPPYDNLRDYNGYVFDFEGIAKELYRVVKDGGVVVWVVGDATVKGSETGTSFKQALYFKEIGFNLHDTMIYKKAGFQFPSQTRYHQIFEYMFVFSKGKPKTFNPINDRKNKWGGPWGKTTTRQKDGSLVERKITQTNDYGMRLNVWRYTNGKGFGQKDDVAYQHPATFPEKLAEDHILSWSNEGDIILDPMAGSGTTLKMAKKNNRRYIGIEISSEYVKICQERLRIQ